jgi:hypothetical protein
MCFEQDYIHTIHPNDRLSVKMKREYYVQISDFILTILNDEAEVTILQLIEKANVRFHDQFREETAWYIYGVKLDMEARGLLKNRMCEKRKMNYIVKERRSKTKRLT